LCNGSTEDFESFSQGSNPCWTTIQKQMKTKLVSITKSALNNTELSPEELIVYIARVSNPANQMNVETAPRLIKYMIDHKHWSPFEMVDMTVEIETSRAIAAQILRHRSFSFQEFSQRYSEATTFEPVEIRKQSAKNRQSSEEVFNPLLLTYDNWVYNATEAVDDLLKEIEHTYKKLIKAGVAKEVARMILPLTTTTKIYMKGSVRSWIHYLQIRTSDDTQKEHRDVANEILNIFAENFPIIHGELF
jgi:thymidylate synthase (FAD)